MIESFLRLRGNVQILIYTTNGFVLLTENTHVSVSDRQISEICLLKIELFSKYMLFQYFRLIYKTSLLKISLKKYFYKDK
jgi:hypothetical protein